MEEKKIRLLEAGEIECRVGTISEKGLSLLLYKDARVDMKILDEVYGPMNWKREHVTVGGSLYCIVSVWDESKGQWVSKMDVGTESNTEKEKGQASDSFKRACVSLGIGRELYTAPFIWISAAKVHIEQRTDERGKPKYFTYDKFEVADIAYNDRREITGLVVTNKDGREVYRLGMSTEEEKPADMSAGKALSQAAEEKEQAVSRELARTGVALDAVLARYGVASIREMDDATYRKAMNSLKRTKAKAA